MAEEPQPQPQPQPKPDVSATGAGAVTIGRDAKDVRIETNVDQSTHHHHHHHYAPSDSPAPAPETGQAPETSHAAVLLSEGELPVPRIRDRSLDRFLEHFGAPGDALLTLLGRRPSLMGRVVAGIDPQADALFAQSALAWRGALLDRLIQLDRSLMWNSETYVELEAEVEEQDATGRSHAIRDFRRALRRHRRHRAILILGDPGSGKSVSLRALARQLLAEDEVRRAGRLALYLNLRDWPTPRAWTEAALPAPGDVAAHLLAWAAEQFAAQAGESPAAIGPHFPRLLDTGRFLLLLDSFDEVPAALDAHESGRLLGIISAAVHQVLHGSARSQRRGLLASRPYRRPVKSLGDRRRPRASTAQPGFDTACQLTMRPLTEGRLRRFLIRHLGGRADLADRFLREAPALAAAARNPFTAMLVVGFLRARLEAGAVALPATRNECYEEALRVRFLQAVADPAVAPLRLTAEDLWPGLKALARAIFDDQRSFDLPAERAAAAWPLLAAHPALVQSLCECAILRQGTAQKIVGFAHRRWAEYFAALTLPLEIAQLPLDHLFSSNGRWRDAMVVWCETAPLETAAALAEWCWVRITGGLPLTRESPLEDSARPDPMDPSEASPVINDAPETPAVPSPVQRLTMRLLGYLYLDAMRKARQSKTVVAANMPVMRFLIEAFRGRTEALRSFSAELSTSIEWRVGDRSIDHLTRKRLGEAVCLLSGDERDRALRAVLTHGTPWMIMEMLRNCRFQESPRRDAADSMASFVHKLPWRQIIARDGLMLSLRLSEGLSFIRREIYCRVVDLALWPVWIACAFCYSLYAGSLYAGIATLLASAFGLTFGWVMFSIGAVKQLSIFARLVTAAAMGYFAFQTYSDNMRMSPLARRDVRVEVIALATLAVTILPVLSYVGTWRASREILIRFLKLGGFALVLFLYFKGTDSLGPKDPHRQALLRMWILWPLSGMFLLFFLWGMAISLSKNISRFVQSRWRLRGLPAHFGDGLTRADVAYWLRHLCAKRPALLFLQRLERDGVLPAGQWPDGRMPTTGISAVDDRLAQLEEQWQEEELRVSLDKETAARAATD